MYVHVYVRALYVDTTYLCIPDILLFEIGNSFPRKHIVTSPQSPHGLPLSSNISYLVYYKRSAFCVSNINCVCYYILYDNYDFTSSILFHLYKEKLHLIIVAFVCS
jgi:hypothetical protein